MKHVYHVVIVAVLVCCILVCTCFSVSAESGTYNQVLSVNADVTAYYAVTEPYLDDSGTYDTWSMNLKYTNYNVFANHLNNLFYTPTSNSQYRWLVLAYDLPIEVNLVTSVYKYKIQVAMGASSKSYVPIDHVAVWLGDFTTENGFKKFIKWNAVSDNLDEWQQTKLTMGNQDLGNIKTINRMYFFFDRRSTSKIPRVWMSPKIQISFSEGNEELQKGLVDIKNQISADNNAMTGRSNNPVAPSGQSNVDSYDTAESQLLNDTSQNRTAGLNAIDGTSSNLSPYTNSLLACTRIWNGITGNFPLVGYLIQISLALGLCAFILNIGTTILSSRKGGGG